MKSTLLLSVVCLLALTSATPPQPSTGTQDPSVSRHPIDFSGSSSDLGRRALGRRRLEQQKQQRRGGGKGGGKAGSGSSSNSGSSGGRPASSYSFSPSSNLGGRTNGGSGTAPSYNGRYTGGAQVPYTSGLNSPSRSYTPSLFRPSAFIFFPSIWLYDIYAYPSYNYVYVYHYPDQHNDTATVNVNITCLCQQYSVCGCDPDTDDDSAIAQQITNGTGSGAPVNTTRVQTIDYHNGTIVSYINGTLDNGTTATGGSDPNSIDQISGAIVRTADWLGSWALSAVVVVVVSLVLCGTDL